MGAAINFKAALQAGISPSAKVDRNAMTLRQCRNGHPVRYGVKTLVSPTYPSTGISQATTWLRTQMLRVGHTLLLMHNTALYEMAAATLTAGRVTPGSADPMYDPSSPASTRTITLAQQQWHGAGFRKAYYLTNGAEFIWKHTYNANESDSQPKIYCSNSTEGFYCNSVCNWKDRLVILGLKGSNLADSNFTALFDHARKNSPMAQYFDEDDTVDSSWMLIGPPAGGADDIPNATLLACVGLPTFTVFTDKFKEIIYTAIENNEIMLVPTRFAGEMKKGLVYGEDLLVYGENCVTRFTMNEAGMVFEAGAISTVGVSGRGGACSNGNDTVHYWVTKQGRLRRFILNDGAKDLDHSNSLNTLTLDDQLVITHDEHEGHWWICRNDDGFCLTVDPDTGQTALGRNDAMCPASLLRLANSASLLGTYIAKADDQAMVIECEPYDAGGGDHRQTFETAYVNFGSTNQDEDGWTCVITVARKQAQTPVARSAVTTDTRGRLRVKESGTEMRWKLSYPNYKQAGLDWVSVDIGRGKPSLRSIADEV